MYNIEMLYKTRSEAIKFCEAKTKAKAAKRTGIKLLIPKQMLQRLPIFLAQVKTRKNY